MARFFDEDPTTVTIVPPKLTYEDLRKMPEDGKRYELIDGEVFMTPASRPRHQRTVDDSIERSQTSWRNRDLACARGG